VAKPGPPPIVSPTLPPPIAIENTLDGKFGGLKNWNLSPGIKLFDYFRIRRVPSAEEFNSLINVENTPAADVDISKYEDLQMTDGVVNGYLNCGMIRNW